MNQQQESSLGTWHTDVQRCTDIPALREWLSCRDSLTSRLEARCEQFSVQVLQQHEADCLADEHDAIGGTSLCRVMERDVLLLCDGVPVVYAHTVLPLDTVGAQWPLFATLGNQSLGATLLNDPLVVRGVLQFARLPSQHPLMLRISALRLLAPNEESLAARRSAFTRHSASMLVTEVFLPHIAALPSAKRHEGSARRGS